jgi:hypothetical protein
MLRPEPQVGIEPTTAPKQARPRFTLSTRRNRNSVAGFLGSDERNSTPRAVETATELQFAPDDAREAELDCAGGTGFDGDPSRIVLGQGVA